MNNNGFFKIKNKVNGTSESLKDFQHIISDCEYLEALSAYSETPKKNTKSLNIESKKDTNISKPIENVHYSFNEDGTINELDKSDSHKKKKKKRKENSNEDNTRDNTNVFEKKRKSSCSDNSSNFETKKKKKKHNENTTQNQGISENYQAKLKEELSEEQLYIPPQKQKKKKHLNGKDETLDASYLSSDFSICEELNTTDISTLKRRKRANSENKEQSELDAPLEKKKNLTEIFDVLSKKSKDKHCLNGGVTAEELFVPKTADSPKTKKSKKERKNSDTIYKDMIQENQANNDNVEDIVDSKENNNKEHRKSKKHKKKITDLGIDTSHGGMAKAESFSSLDTFTFDVLSDRGSSRLSESLSTSSSFIYTEKEKKHKKNKIDKSGEIPVEKKKKKHKKLAESNKESSPEDISSSGRDTSVDNFTFEDFGDNREKKHKKSKKHVNGENDQFKEEKHKDVDSSVVDVAEIMNCSTLADRTMEKKKHKKCKHKRNKECVEINNRKKDRDNGDDEKIDVGFNGKSKRRQSVLLDGIAGRRTAKIKSETIPLEEISNISINKLLNKAKDRKVLSKEEISQLARIFIIVPWPIPPLHLIETRVANRPTPEQRKQMEALGIEIKQGIFTKLEDEQIKKNWDEFWRTHDMPPDPTPFLNFIHSDSVVTMPTLERIKFVRFLAHGLNDRPLCSVYKRFRRLYLNPKIVTGRFTPEEDKIILEYIKTGANKARFANLAKILNRHNLAVTKRYKKLTQKEEKVTWDRQSIKIFVENLQEIIGCSTEELKDRQITPEEWKQLSEKYNISTPKLRRAWLCTIHPRIFINDSVSINIIKEELVNLLIEKNYDDWRSIQWNQIAQEFEGFTGERLNKMFKEMVSYHVPLDMQPSLQGSLEYLKNTDFKKQKLKKIHIQLGKLHEPGNKLANPADV